MQKARVAAQGLIRSIGANERMALYTSSGTVTVPLTHDAAVLLAGVAKLRQNAVAGPRELGVCPSMDSYRAFAISHYVDEEVRQQAISRSVVCKCPASVGETAVEDHMAASDTAIEVK